MRATFVEKLAPRARRGLPWRKYGDGPPSNDLPRRPGFGLSAQAPAYPARISAPSLGIAPALAATLLVGAVCAVNTQAAIGLAIATALAAAVLRKPSAMLIVLMSSVFLELINIGGLTISRLLAPVALLVLMLSLVRPGTEIRSAPPLFWALAYASWAVASGLWSLSVPGTLYLLASLGIALVYMLCFASLLTTRRELDRLLGVLGVVSAAIGTLSILAFLGRPVLGFGLLQEGRVQGGTGDP